MRRSAPSFARLALAALLAAACGRAPKVEPPAAGTTAASDPAITLESATLVSGKVAVTYRLTDRGAPLLGAAAAAMKPTWTLAWLDVEPVSQFPAWRAMTLNGPQVIPSLPPAGPGTPAAQVVTNTRQPLGETGGTTQELGDGRFTYTFKDALSTDFWPPSGVNAGATLRVGVVLYGVTSGTATTCATIDFTPNGGPLQSYALVRDENCNGCHGLLRMHGKRYSGVKFCVTCHNWLHADPDTLDPAAMPPATKATNPNPLELGRMVHRIHRGKRLPTLYQASDAAAANRTWPPDNPVYSSGASPWPASPFLAAPPLPYNPTRTTGSTATNPPAAVGTKFNVIGMFSTEFVFGRVSSRIENFQPARTTVDGVGFPRDLRDCDACHAGAPEAYKIGKGTSTDVSISRRTCSGCHPDVFFGDPNDLMKTTPDATHFAHTGGRQLDDSACKYCHVLDCPTADPVNCGNRKLYAPIAEIHRPPMGRGQSVAPQWNRWSAEIVDVQNMKAGLAPTVKFKVWDRDGPVAPLDAPTLAAETGPYASPVPRRMALFSLVYSGPTSDYVSNNAVTRVSLVSRAGGVTTLAPGFNPVPDGNGVFTYTFSAALPSTAAGTWSIGTEGRRRPDAAPPLYDPATDTFAWPFTAEAISEYGTSDVKYVDLSTGTITTDPTRARRTVVDQARCEKCHLELNLHGANRHDVAYCVFCHAPDASDWDRRPRDTRTSTDPGGPGTGMVLLSDPIDPTATTKRWGYATLDGIEERSIHFKVLVHRIHTGEHVGAASLEGIRPFVVYGMAATPQSAPNPFFLDDVRFPGDLANCEVCHLKDTWTLEALPASAASTLANERGNLRHTGTSTAPATAAHAASGEATRLPIASACLSCHTNGAAVTHAADKTVSGVEQCPSCHGASGSESVRKWHDVP